MEYKQFVGMLKLVDTDIWIKFKGDNGWYYLFCEPTEYYSRKVSSFEVLIDGERVSDELDDELYNKNEKIHKTDAVHILLYEHF